MRTTFLVSRLLLGLFLAWVGLVATGGVSQAQSISISPLSGPSGTMVFITNADPQSPAQCFVNGSYFADLPGGGTLTPVMDFATGSQIEVGCRYDVEGPLTTAITFIVTAIDSDQDGISDDQDQCPQEFAQTQSGCPDAAPQDTDQDGLPDNQDQCPQQFAQTQSGCPDAAPQDSDQDGISDDRDQCPQQFAQTQTGCPDAAPQATVVLSTVPAPVTQDAALPVLPGAGGPCVIATREGTPVNVRSGPATTTDILTQLVPSEVYEASAYSDGWYFLASVNGWVREDVVRVGGNCTAVLAGVATPPPDGSTLETFVVPALVDYSQELSDCPDLASQASRLPLVQTLTLVRLSDPCGALREAIRSIAFGQAPPLGWHSTVLTNRARCSTDLRPLPTPELLRFLASLEQIDPDLARQVNLAIAAATGSAPGSDGDKFLCAMARGDIFQALRIRTILEFDSPAKTLKTAAAVCVPPMDAAIISDIVDEFIGESGASFGFPLDLIALNPSDMSLAEYTSLLCSGLSAFVPVALTPDQQAVVDWLTSCGYDPSSIQYFVEQLNTGSAEVFGFAGGFNWSQLGAFYRSYGQGACPTQDEFRRFLLRSGDANTRNSLVTTRSETAAIFQATYGNAGIVYNVVCDSRTPNAINQTEPRG